jgi:hypothetical protein
MEAPEMKQFPSSGLNKLGSSAFCDEKIVVSNRGDVEMIVRSMRSSWLQKAKMLPQDDSGLGDSGAQISVTNVATATKFGLERHTYDTPIRIGFAQGAEVLATEYVIMGSILGEVPVLEAETIFSLWSICENGYEIILDCDQIRVRDKSSGEFVYQAASSPSDREWRLDTAMMLCMEPSSGRLDDRKSSVRASKLLNRDIGDVVTKSASKRGPPRITTRIKNAIIWMHNCLCHTASPGAIAAALRNGEAWSGMDIEFTAAMVEAVFKHHTCIVCQIAKWNKQASCWNWIRNRCESSRSYRLFRCGYWGKSAEQSWQYGFLFRGVQCNGHEIL